MGKSPENKSSIDRVKMLIVGQTVDKISISKYMLLEENRVFSSTFHACFYKWLFLLKKYLGQHGDHSTDK